MLMRVGTTAQQPHLCQRGGGPHRPAPPATPVLLQLGTPGAQATHPMQLMLHCGLAAPVRSDGICHGLLWHPL